VTDYKLEFSGVYGTGRRWSTGVHVSTSADIITTLTDWSAQVVSFWTNGTHGVETLYATSTVLDTISAIQLGATMQELQRLDGPTTLAGTDTSQEGAGQLAILVSLRNVFSGARNRGRMYLPAPAEDTVNEGILGGTEATRVSTAIIALFSGMRGAGYSFFVFNDAAHPHDPVPFTKKTITSEKVDKVLRTQRRRIRKELPQYV
jgi:hypothetical protein